MKVRTYAIITIRAHIAPYVVIAAALVERLTRDHETLHALAALAMIAAPLWLLWVTLRDPATVVDDLTCADSKTRKQRPQPGDDQ